MARLDVVKPSSDAEDVGRASGATVVVLFESGSGTVGIDEVANINSEDIEVMNKVINLKRQDVVLMNKLIDLNDQVNRPQC
jgi:hypothetical protein